MYIRDQIDKLCEEFPACRIVAYADLATGMVLCSNSQARLPQEQLDDLCATAVDLLTGQMAARFMQTILGNPGDAVQTALLIEGHCVEVFLRTSPRSTEGLCCDCTAQINLPDFTKAAHDLLVRISDAP